MRYWKAQRTILLKKDLSEVRKNRQYIFRTSEKTTQPTLQIMKLHLSHFIVALSLFVLRGQATANTHTVGVGIHYWQAISDIDVTDIKDSGISQRFAYQYDSGFVAVHVELEVFPEEFAGASDNVYSPQLMAVVGENLYAGVGIGMFYTDGEFAEDPYFVLRAGFTITSIGPLTLDLNASYIFTDFNSFDQNDIDTDTVTLGAMIRIDL